MNKDEITAFINKLSNEEVWTSYSLIRKELKNRELVRTKNLVGERGEQLAINFYNTTADLPKLQAASEGTRNVDALSRKGERYAIKTVTHPTTSKTGVFYGLEPPDSSNADKQLFEYVIIVKINDDLEMEQIIEVDWKMFHELKKWDKRMTAWFLGITKKLNKEGRILFIKE